MLIGTALISMELDEGLSAQQSNNGEDDTPRAVLHDLQYNGASASGTSRTAQATTSGYLRSLTQRARACRGRRRSIGLAQAGD